MAFQVLVKTTPGMAGSYSYDLVSREAADVFVQRSDVWWWCFPLEEDTLDGGSWHRGGAWVTAAVQSGISGDLSAVAPEDPSRLSLAGVADAIPLSAYLAESDEKDDDDRW